MTRRDLYDSLPDDELPEDSVESPSPDAGMGSDPADGESSLADGTADDEEAEDSESLGSDDPQAIAFLNAVSASLDAQEQAALEQADETSGDVDASPAEPSETEPDSAQATVGPSAEVPLRSSGRRLDFGPRKLPPPTPFEQLVMDMSAAHGEPPPLSPSPNVTPPVEAFAPRGVLPDFTAPASLGGTPGAITVNVQVSLTEDAIRRVAEAAVRELAGVSHKQLEIVAKRLFDLDQEIFAREANRRALYRY